MEPLAARDQGGPAAHALGQRRDILGRQAYRQLARRVLSGGEQTGVDQGIERARLLFSFRIGHGYTCPGETRRGPWELR